MLQLLSDSSRGAHLAGVTVSLLTWLLQRSTTAGISSLQVCIVLVRKKGTCRLPLIRTVLTCLTPDIAMSVPRPGKWVNGKCTEYLGCTDKVFVAAISIESSASYNNIFSILFTYLYLFIRLLLIYYHCYYHNQNWSAWNNATARNSHTEHNNDTYHWRMFSVKQLEELFEVFSIDAVACNQQKQLKHQLSHHFTHTQKFYSVVI